MTAPKALFSMKVSTPEAALDRWVYNQVIPLSGRAVTAVALFLYPGIGLVLPLAFGASTFHLVLANLLGTVLAACVCVGWLSGHRLRLADGAISLSGLQTFASSTLRSSSGSSERCFGGRDGLSKRPDARMDPTGILTCSSPVMVKGRSFSANAGLP